MTGATNTSLRDTWAFEGDDWRQLGDLPADVDPRSVQLVHDRARGRTILWETELYELRGDVWVEVPLEELPNSRTLSFYDEQTERVTFIGGTVGINDLGDIFTWDGSSSARAAHIAEIDLISRVAANDALGLSW